MQFLAHITNLALVSSLRYAIAQAQHADFMAPLPPRFATSSIVLLKNNLAVIPGEWYSKSQTSYFYDLSATDESVQSAFKTIRDTSFIAWDESFLDIVGAEAKLEVIQTFSSPENQHVHEAPVYLPETNELLYSDTTDIGQLQAINVDTRKVRKISTNPPLYNVNGGTHHNGVVYVVTNGGSVRGLYSLNVTTGEAECLLNNYRGRRLNSPNDLVFDSLGNILFTDPHYGLVQNWPGVQEPELPNAVYHFNTKTKALTALYNSAIHMPNGLALSIDGSRLYVGDSNSSLNSPTSVRNVYAFDFSGTALTNPRLVYQAEAGFPDGIRVSRSGLLFISAANGVDVVNPQTGLLLGKINTPDDIIYNLEPARGKSGVWLLTGGKNIYKATISEPGNDRSDVFGIPRLLEAHGNTLQVHFDTLKSQVVRLYKMI